MGEIFFPSEHHHEVCFGVVCSSFGWTVYSRVALWRIFGSTDACELLPALQHVYWPPAGVCTWPPTGVCTWPPADVCTWPPTGVCTWPPADVCTTVSSATGCCSIPSQADTNTSS